MRADKVNPAGIRAVPAKRATVLVASREETLVIPVAVRVALVEPCSTMSMMSRSSIIKPAHV